MILKIHNKSKLISYLIISLFLVGLLLYATGCTKDDDQAEPDHYAFWLGDTTTHYFCYDMLNKPLHQVNGRPFMVMEYDPETGAPVKCEFGFSEAENKYLPGVEYAIPEALIDALSLEYAGKLELLSPVVLLCNWERVSSQQALATGEFEFQITRSNGESFNFIYSSSDMEGEIINPDGEWGERVSDVGAFNMLRKFNNSSIGK